MCARWNETKASKFNTQPCGDKSCRHHVDFVCMFAIANTPTTTYAHAQLCHFERIQTQRFDTPTAFQMKRICNANFSVSTFVDFTNLRDILHRAYENKYDADFLTLSRSLSLALSFWLTQFCLSSDSLVRLRSCDSFTFTRQNGFWLVNSHHLYHMCESYLSLICLM